MNLPLPGIRRMPKHVVFLGKDSARRYFRIHTGWDGALVLREKNSVPRKRSALLVLDAGIPLRRLFRIPTRHRGIRNLMLATSADAFPFDVDEGMFALGTRDAKSYVFALEPTHYEEIAEDFPAPVAVLVASSGAQADILAAVDGWLRDGSVRDMLAGPRPLKPSTLLLGAQMLVLLGLAWFAVDSWTTRNRDMLDRQLEVLERTREEAEPLLARRRSVFRMVETDKALSTLQRLPGVAARAHLNAVLSALPEGTRIDRIQLDGQQLAISGWGSDPKEWLDADLGAAIETKVYPKDDRFKLTFELSSPEPSASAQTSN